MTTLLSMRSAIVSEITSEIPAFKSVAAFGGEFGLEDLLRYATKSPAARVGCMGFRSSYEAGEYVLDVDWVIAIVTRDTATKRGDQLLTLAQAINKVVTANDWGCDAKAPDGITGRNMFSGTLDKQGVALWVTAWTQRLEVDEYDLSTLDDFDTLYAKYDLWPIDGVVEAEDRIDLRGTWMSAYGQIYISSAIATSIAVAGTYQKAAGTTTIGDYSGMDMPVTGRLRHTGTVSKPFMVHANLSVTVSSDAKVTLALAKNGVVDANTAVEHEIAAASDPVAFGLNDIVSLDENDYVEVWATADDTVNVTVTKMNLIAGAN